MTKKQLCVAVVLASSFAPTYGQAANEESAAFKQGDNRAHVSPVLPTLQISGGTDGKSSFKVGFDISIGFKVDRDLTISPIFQAATSDGFGSLFSFAGSNATPNSNWFGGVQVTFAQLPNGLPSSGSSLRALRAVALDAEAKTIDTARAKAMTLTRAACKRALRRSSQQQSLCDGLERMTVTDMAILAAVGELSAEEARLVDALVAQRGNTKAEEVRSLSNSVTALKNQVASLQDARHNAARIRVKLEDDTTQTPRVEQDDRYVQIDLDDPSSISNDEVFSDDARAVLHTKVQEAERAKLTQKLARDLLAQFPRWQVSVAGTLGSTEMKYYQAQNPATTLKQVDHNYLVAQAAAAASLIRDDGLTLEVPLTYTRTHSAAKGSVYACHLAGTAAGSSDTLTSCIPGYGSSQTVPVGGPSETDSVYLSAYLGYVDRTSRMWRAAVGPTFHFSDDAGSKVYGVAGEIPIYLAFAKTDNGYSGSYTGIIRITPSLGWQNDASAGSHFVALLTLELLGSRHMFDKALSYVRLQ